MPGRIVMQRPRHREKLKLCVYRSCHGSAIGPVHSFLKPCILRQSWQEFQLSHALGLPHEACGDGRARLSRGRWRPCSLSCSNGSPAAHDLTRQAQGESDKIFGTAETDLPPGLQSGKHAAPAPPLARARWPTVQRLQSDPLLCHVCSVYISV
jgi:hypothetical protein